MPRCGYKLRAMVYVNDEIDIPDDELEERFIRSPGAGGQNVNKVSSGVQLRFDALGSSVISKDVFARLKTLAGQRMSKSGVLLIIATSFRTQDLNRKDARARLVELVRQALVVPKYRRATRPSKAQKLKRLETKKREGARKKTRGRVGSRNDDY